MSSSQWRPKGSRRTPDDAGRLRAVLLRRGYVDAVEAQGMCCGSGEAVDRAAIGGPRRRLAWAENADNRTEIDDLAVALCDHLARHGLAAEKITFYAAVERIVEIFFLEIEKLLIMRRHAGVNQNIDADEGVDAAAPWRRFPSGADRADSRARRPFSPRGPSASLFKIDAGDVAARGR
jgi:hypothetical protein